MDSSNNQDSPLSTSANVIGILTFVVAIAAAAYARIAFLRNSDDEYFRVKTSLSWYKTESTWLAELLRAMDDAQEGEEGDEKKRLKRQRRQRQQQQMYKFVMDDLLNLEQRLLDLVTDIEVKSALRGASEWTLLPRRWAAGRARPSVAVSWLGVRTKALELVRQREALTARVQFLQVSMVSARMGDLEARLRVFEERRDAALVRADEDEETTEEWQSDYGE
ncbi:uncharacterized protein TrAtP1_005488 [Trichoderma atroviride]|uniref:Uncharacterized protein n=1 Tax=Hypocrea atroviridis (strain ATCC 20476 / IMI 206040) TaxID=452589 RepID=G9NRB5_HYPAI|nr:uncharacterized protein TRIATDRAFT_283037 [Trichoderma atroviride IMI 206040]EHK46550.1 hypothetical protein TRIATDRAFT_283037 [Trichoderma atroviride IMI 206040]UKZ64270.1 hypothetical protein TrAtP1_005488 [Trichoderma atroviride]